MIVRTAVPEDLPAVLALLVDDVLGRSRDSAEVDEEYERAFLEIQSDPRGHLLVGEDDGRIVGCAQVFYLPGLSRHGARRCLVEAVRIHSELRGHGLGRQLLTWVIEEARRRGCAVVQLTTDKSRVDAHRFYARLGFAATHEGMKLPL